MTVRWSAYAQSQTKQPVKGMLTGPSRSCNGVRARRTAALGDREAARARDPRRGAVTSRPRLSGSFKSTSPRCGRGCRCGGPNGPNTSSGRSTPSAGDGGVKDETHPYAHVLQRVQRRHPRDRADGRGRDLVESARSGSELVEAFKEYKYRTRSGRASTTSIPCVPSTTEIVDALNRMRDVLDRRQIWVNPDCGLKTRGWEETLPSLRNMVEAPASCGPPGPRPRRLSHRGSRPVDRRTPAGHTSQHEQYRRQDQPRADRQRSLQSFSSASRCTPAACGGLRRWRKRPAPRSPRRSSHHRGRGRRG